MGNILNQYSYLLISAGALLAILVMMRVLRFQWRLTLAAVIGMVVILCTGWLILRPAGSDVQSANSDEAILNNGKPTFVEFYSETCLECIANRPSLDAIIPNLKDNFNILRVDIHSDFGHSLREKYNFSDTPEFMLLDASGHEVWRAQEAPSVQELLLAINTPVRPGNS